MNGKISFVEFLTILSVWIVAAAIIYFTQSIMSAWLVDIIAIACAYYLSKFIILKKD